MMIESLLPLLPVLTGTTSLSILYYVVVVCVLFSIVVLCDELNDLLKRLPSGPVRLPIWGNRIQLHLAGHGRPWYVGLTEIAKKHGRHMKIFFGHSGYVSVNGSTALKEAMEEERWSTKRDDLFSLNGKSEDNNNPAGTYSLLMHRRGIVTQSLVDYISKAGQPALIATLVQEQLESLLTERFDIEVDGTGKLKIAASKFLPPLMCSSLRFLLGKENFTQVSKNLPKFLENTKKWESTTVKTLSWKQNYPLFARIFPAISGTSKRIALCGKFRKDILDLVNDVRESIKQNKRKGITEEGGFLHRLINTEEDSFLVEILFEFLCLGPLVFSRELAFCLQHFSKHPALQMTIVAEAERYQTDLNLCRERTLLPHANAFMLESYRTSSVVPLERRYLLNSVRIGETRFPKSMPLLFNYYDANMDERAWKEPQIFNPRRFMGNNDQLISQDKLLSLAAEKHICLAQPFMRFILTSALLQIVSKWKLTLDTKCKEKDVVYNGLMNEPTPFELNVVSQF